MRLIPSLLALSIVASTPGSTAKQVSCQSSTGSPDSPFENDERYNALFSSVEVARIISRIASVESKRENCLEEANLTAVVDYPTPDVPAINTNTGGLPPKVVVVTLAKPTFSTMV